MVDKASKANGNASPADAAGGALLRLEHLSVDFFGHGVLRDINLNIARGETLAVIGESGCGKTVLLKTILGLLRPSRGKVFFEGRNLAEMNERQLTEERIRFGFLFQQAALFDSLTVAQNVAFPLRQHTSTAAAEIRQVVLARLAEVGLPLSVLGQKPAELSGGMRKRVGLARALALEPEVMLYDEPTTGLDPIMADVINELILNTRRQHPVTSVLVTHDMRTARKVADRVVMLYPLSRLGQDEPQIIFDGPPQRLDDSAERRVRQFVRGEAGERLREHAPRTEGRNMDERKMQFRVGVMVLAALLSTATLVALFGNVPSLIYHAKKTIYVRFLEAPGVSRDTPVRKSGILIGRVSAIEFNKDDTAVVATLKIDADRRVYHDEVCRIVSSLIGGDAVLEFVRSAEGGAHTPVADGETIQGSVASDPTRAIVNLEQSLGETMGRVNRASDALGRTFERIDELLGTNQQRINHVIASTDETMKILNTTLHNANDIIGEPETRKQFKDAIAQLPSVLKNTGDTAKQLGDAMSSVKQNLDNLKGLTEPLGQRGELLVNRMTEGTNKLNQVMDEMLQFSHAMNSPNSAFSQLVNNPELTQHLCRAAKNIDELTRQLKPIIDDTRVFSDKIARHPEMLGVRGAIQRSPGIK